MSRPQDQEKINKFCHDLRNHLTVMKVNTELMSLSPTFLNNAEFTKFLDTINREMDKIMSLLNEVENYKE
jgi:hypothetical protein